MRLKPLLGLVALAMAGAAIAAKPKVVKQPAPQMLELNFSATVQADGTLADIVPDASLPEPIQALIRARAATWRYTPAQWQGKAFPKRIDQTIKAQAMPAANGGFAMRIEEVAFGVKYTSRADKIVSRMPPIYPPDLRRRGVNAVLIYAVLLDETGRPVQVDLLYPTELDRDIQRFDEAARDSIAKWVYPQDIEGVPISCRTIGPITFQVEGAADPRIPPGLGASYVQKYTDRCPNTALETPVKGTFL